MANEMLKEKLEQKSKNTNEMAEIITLPNSTNFSPMTVNAQVTYDVVPQFAITLDEAKQRLSLLQDFVKTLMIPGQDYGIIPRCDKPTLLKSGAEKLTDIYGLSKHIEVIHRVENWEQGFFHYEVKTCLINKRSGLIEAEGIGSCNSKEKKYQSSQPFNIINTILKMAKKRSFIDAVLSATRSSGLFTQDLEDGLFVEQTEQPSPPVAKRPIQTKPYSSATKNQLNKIQSLVADKSISIDDARNHMTKTYSVNESKKLSFDQADDFIKYLIKY